MPSLLALVAAFNRLEVNFSDSSSISLGPPTCTKSAPTVALAPRPDIAENFFAVLSCSFLPFAKVTIAFAIGCSDSSSTEAAKASTSLTFAPSVMISTTPCSPLVSVPVLSNNTTSIFLADSSAIRSRTSRPFFAARVVEIAVTRGTARPSACGQAITRTVTTLSRINEADWSLKNVQPIAVSIAAPSAINVK